MGKKSVKRKQPVSRRAKIKPFFFQSVTLYHTSFFSCLFLGSGIIIAMVWLIILALNQIKFYSRRKTNVFQMLEIPGFRDNHAGKAIDVSEYQGKSVGLMWIPGK
jgi:hypothetical protein